ncbi:MAG: CheY-like chemotaxis protein [Lentimonas sp.]|jgi:CheY-like chemotaxis protein
MAGRILVLDDEENYAQMLQELLREHNYRVDMATRPERAIDQLEEIPYDLVISDYKMPVMDGSDFLKRARELYPHLPFILVSGLMNTPELVKVANMSVTLVMEKPLNTSVFLKQVARFSDPMTDEEKASVSQDQSAGSHASVASDSYPSEPRYFSAKSDLSKCFLRKAWTAACREKGHLFLLDGSAGEGELVLKDLSLWRGKGDQPIETLEFSELMNGGDAKLKSIAEDSDKSNVVCVQIPSTMDLISVVEFVGSKLVVVDSLFLVFIVGKEWASDFDVNTLGKGLRIPSIAQRPSDIAEYISRFMHFGRKRNEQPRFVEFSTEAIYALLAYEWSSYLEIQDVILRVAGEGDASLITLERLNPYLNSTTTSTPEPSKRLFNLLKQTQTRYLDSLIGPLERSPVELSKRLDLDQSMVLESADLNELPLIDPGLAQF